MAIRKPVSRHYIHTDLDNESLFAEHLGQPGLKGGLSTGGSLGDAADRSAGGKPDWMARDLCSECHRPLPPKIIKWGGVEVVLDRSEIRVDGRHIHLTPTQACLAALMVESRGRIVPYAQIEDSCYSADIDMPLSFDLRNNVKQYLCQIRKKTGLDMRAVSGQGIMMLEPE